MRSLIRHPVVAACAFAATGLIFVACSESPAGPLTRMPNGADATVVGSLPNLGTPQLTVKSGDAGVHFCGFNATQAPVVGTFPGTDCGSASANLSSALAVYNPGWSNPANFPALTGSSWIGPTGLAADGANPGGAPSSDYAAPFGTYEFVTTFAIPSGVTSPALQFSGMADNAMVVYLNGVEIGQHTFLQDCTTAQAATTPPSCNWDVPLLMNNSPATLNIGGNNILRIDLVGTSIGLITDGVSTATSACSPFPPLGPQTDGFLGFTSTTVATFPGHAVGGTSWNTTTCLNPTGLDFVANVFWTVPVVNHGCTLGFWKNHDGSGPQPDVWPSPYTPSTTLAAAGFTNTGNQTTTLDAALSFSGGPTVQDAKNNLMKQAVAALLNAATPGMNYPLTVTQVLTQVNAALATGDKTTILNLAATLDADNSLEGPLC